MASSVQPFFTQYSKGFWRIFSKKLTAFGGFLTKVFRDNKIISGTDPAIWRPNKKGALVKSHFSPSGDMKLMLPAVFLLISLNWGIAEAASVDQSTFPTNPGLEDYLKWAEDHNPGVAEASGRMTALRHSAHEVGALPDLRFGWGEMIVPVETRVGPQQRVFSLSQSFPWFGTLGLKETVAARQADVAVEEVRGQLLRVHHRIRASWFDLAFLQGEIAIITGNLALFGIATDDGVLMATYLDLTFAKNRPVTRKEIRQATVVAATRRVRPALMTSATTILALMPVLTLSGRGADIMIPRAIPSFGGMIIALLTLFTVPVLYSLREERRTNQHREI
jgi:hypothetical protein